MEASVICSECGTEMQLKMNLTEHWAQYKCPLCGHNEIVEREEPVEAKQ